MINNTQKADVLIIGEDTSKQAKISANKMAKLQYLLTKGLYKDPITAVIAEWTNNAIDSVVQSGKDPIENPVMVRIDKRKNQNIFSVEDEGVGLDDNDFENICMNYLESTKEDDNDTIGHFGIGMKSFLSLERPAKFTCRKNGIQRVYLVYEGTEFVDYELISELPTSEPNGVKAEIVLKDYSETQAFISKAKAKLKYYETAVLILFDKVHTTSIYRHELFQYISPVDTTTMHIALKDVYYPIDWEALGIYQINIPIALRIGLDDKLMPTPSRESYITTEATKEMLLNKIKDVATWFVNKYNEKVDKIDNFIDAYKHIVSSKEVLQLEGHSFNISLLVPYSRVAVHDPKIPYINIRDVDFYKDRISDLLSSFEKVAYVYHGTYKTKKIRTNLVNMFRDKVINNKENICKIVIVDHTPVGNEREFLKYKYTAPEVLFVAKSAPIHLGKSTEYDSRSYRHMANLTLLKKNFWRDAIKEFQTVSKSITDTFEKQTNLANNPEFIQWVKDKKQFQAQERANKRLTGTYVGLNKKKGQVTLSYLATGRYGKSFLSKGAYSVENLTKNKYLTVLCYKEEESLARGIFDNLQKNKGVKIAIVGKLEIKKIPDHYQFIKLEKFMKNSKAFKRMATAILFERTINDYTKLQSNNADLLDQVLPALASNIRKMSTYVSQNKTSSYSKSNQVDEVIFEFARDNDLFDKSMWDIYIPVKEAVEKYGFIKYFNIMVDDRSKDETKRSIRKVIAQLLLFRKLYFKDLPEEIDFIINTKKQDVCQAN